VSLVINAKKVETDPDVEDLIGWQVQSFVVSVRFGNVVEVATSVVGDFYERMPLLDVNAGGRQWPRDPNGQLGALLVNRRHACHADQQFWIGRLFLLYTRMRTRRLWTLPERRNRCDLIEVFKMFCGYTQR